jgi:hypothetical protein
MTAFETSSRIAEHEGTRYEGCPTIRSPVLKSALRDGADAYQIVLLFERPVVRTGRTGNVLDPPASANRSFRLRGHASH